MLQGSSADLVALCTDIAGDAAGPPDGAGCLKSLSRFGMATHAPLKDAQTYSLKQNAGAKLPTPAAFTCPTIAPFALKACPGSPAGTTCTPGVDALRGRPDPALSWGCCACRTAKSYTPAYSKALVTTWCGPHPHGLHLDGPAGLHLCSSSRSRASANCVAAHACCTGREQCVDRSLCAQRYLHQFR